jgi:hypothetical protein
VEERFQVDTLLRSEWSLRRLFRVEAHLWEYHAMCSDRSAGVPLGEGFNRASAVFMRLQRRVSASERAYREAYKELARLQGMRTPLSAPAFAGVQPQPQPCGAGASACQPQMPPQPEAQPLTSQSPEPQPPQINTETAPSAPLVQSAAAAAASSPSEPPPEPVAATPTVHPKGHRRGSPPHRPDPADLSRSTTMPEVLQ